MDILELIGRKNPLLSDDINKYNSLLKEKIKRSSFIVIGGAGSIGQAVVKELFVRNPKKLHVVDISENNLVELVRDIRSSYGYISGDFKTFALDCAGIEFSAMYEKEGPYDFVLNLSALKHVRSEKDPYTLMRMVQVNILNTVSTIEKAIKFGSSKYFCVSTDKAANPVNMMGASKRIMEMFLMLKGESIDISTARFANVAFSDGSLLHGFNQRLMKRQPIAAPNDIRRYFVSSQEAGQLCLLSAILGHNREIFFPKLSEELNLITFSSIAEKFLRHHGYEPYLCETEQEAREKIDSLIKVNKWPCCFFPSDTTGEKDFEEFFTENEEVDFSRFENLGIVLNSSIQKQEVLEEFMEQIEILKKSMLWTRQDILGLFQKLIPNFSHKETGKYLDEKM
jgi:FlaA1/EpsC-like NDP-sugar epimerase